MALGAFVFAAVGVAAVVQFPRAHVLDGELIATSAASAVVAPQAGIVRSLAIREGSVVKSGQPLAAIDVDPLRESIGSVGLATLAVLQQHRIHLTSMLKARPGDEVAERSHLSEAKSAIAQQLEEVEEQLRTTKSMADLSAKSLIAVQPLADKGFISKDEVANREQGLLRLRVQQQSLNQQSAVLKGQMADLEQRFKVTERDLRNREEDLNTSLLQVDEQIASATAGRAVVLTAPISGTVSTLQTSQGQPVKADQTLFSIAPSHSGLEAEIHVPPEIVGDVHPGEPIELDFETSSAGQPRSMSGVVLSISASPLKLSQSKGAGEKDIYILRAKPTFRPGTTNLGRRLVVGLPLKARVVVRNRSFIGLVWDAIRGR